MTPQICVEPEFLSNSEKRKWSRLLDFIYKDTV